MSIRTTAIALALTLAFASVGSSAQTTVAGVKLANSVNVGGQTLVLNGAGVRKKLFVKVYVGALYLPTKQSDPAAILGADTPRQQVMHFVYDVDKGKIAEAWADGLTANTPNASAEVKSAFGQLESWMEDMTSGQEIVLTYVPGSGTTIDVKGVTKGTLRGGKDVADAILATWIGPSPGPGQSFKTAVLGL